MTDEVIDRFLDALRPDDPALWPQGTGDSAVASSTSATSLHQP